MSATSAITQIIPTPHLAVHVGDSLTHGYQQPCTPGEMWPSQLKTLLQGLGANIRPYNQGISGNTTSNMRGRMANFLQHGVPEVAFIFGGTNDTVAAAGTIAASPIPTTTGVSVGSGEGVKYSVGGWVIINGQSRQLTSVSTDAIAWTTPITLPSAGDTVYHDTSQNIQDIANYLIAAGTDRVMVIGCAYVNYASGSGDYYSITTVSSATTSAITVPAISAGGTTLAAAGYCVIGGEERLISSITGAGPYVLNLSTPLTSAPAAGASVTKSYAPHAAVRVKQKAAVTALTAANPTKSIVYCDLHSHQLALIASGAVAQGDDLAWYNFVGNYHFSAAGSLMFAQAVVAKINATSGWLAALS